MGLDASSDPLIFGSVDSGNWVVPGAWGIGSWAGGTPNISLSHHQQYVWSDSIRISVCSTTSFNDTPATTPWGDQLNLTNWYQYYPDNPCKMKVWVQVFNTGGTANQRLLVIWGRPNIGGTADWFVVGLSGSVAIANPSSTSFILWDDPPPQNFTDHPCLRVYVLPDSLPQSWVTKLTTPNIAIPPSTTNNAVKLDESDRTALEMQFGLTGESWLTAQMNFTAIRTGICQTPGCNSLTALSRPVTWLAEWLRNPRAPAAEMRTGAGAFAQPQRGREIPKPVAFPGPDFKISAIGIGFSRASVRSKPSHTYLTNIGGIAWAVPINEMQASKQRGTRIDVQNPRVLAPGRGNVKPIESPPRIVMLDTIVRSTEKRPWWWFFGRQTPLPVVRIDAPSRPLKPGETVPVTLTFVAR
jgi:hypothetical protein